MRKPMIDGPFLLTNLILMVGGKILDSMFTNEEED